MKKMISHLIGFYLNVLAFIAPQKAALVGFRLFCYPVRGKISKHQRQFLQDASQFLIHHKGDRIQGYTWGKGPINILLLHGWQSHSYRWKRYVESIDQTQYTIYAFDAPGHGLSSGNFLTVPLYSEVVTKVIEHIGRAHIVLGHSIGSFTALYTFHTHPSLQPDKLIATACPGEAREFFKFYQMQLGLSDRCIQQIAKRFEKEVQHSPAYFSAQSFTTHLHVQGLLIHDQEDGETPVENALTIHQSWKNSQLILTKGKGHNLKSDEVVAHVINFISQETTLPEVTKHGGVRV